MMWGVAAIGFFSGIISGMGIGGGTILIPALLFLTEVNQQQAQGVNLIYFIPTAVVALITHRKNGTLDLKTAKPLALLGLAGAASVPWPPAIRCGRTVCGKFPRGKPLQSACCRVSAIPSPGPDCGGCLPPCFCCRSSCAFYRRKTGDFSPIPSFLPDIPTDCSAPCPVLCSIP